MLSQERRTTNDNVNGTPDNEDQSADEEGRVDDYMTRDAIVQMSGADEEETNRPMPVRRQDEKDEDGDNNDNETMTQQPT